MDQLSNYYKLQHQGFKTNFDFVKKFQCHFYFFKLNNTFFYMSFEAFFVIIYKKKSMKILGSRNSWFKRSFNFNIAKLIVWKTRKDSVILLCFYILLVFRIFRSPYIVEYTYDVGKWLDKIESSACVIRIWSNIYIHNSCDNVARIVLKYIN